MMKTSEEIALIFDIQGFSVHDGPGGRTLVFFKGCPLHCTWCSNPEGENKLQEVIFRQSNCQKCYNCIEHCPDGAISIDVNHGGIQLNRAACQHCRSLACTEYCYDSALGIVGKYMTQEDLMRKIERDRRFWGNSGGITLGGGEMMVQYKFAARFLAQCQRNYIHTAIETSGYASWDHYLEVLKYVDWAFVDIKHMDDDKHRLGTGVSNSLILKNITKMAKSGNNFRLIPRVPVIPGFNNDENNICKTAEFLRDIGLHEVNLLPFHRLGTSKYEQLGREYIFSEQESLKDDMLKNIKSCFESYGIACYVGSNTPF